MAKMSKNMKKSTCWNFDTILLTVLLFTCENPMTYSTFLSLNSLTIELAHFCFILQSTSVNSKISYLALFIPASKAFFLYFKFKSPSIDET